MVEPDYNKMNSDRAIDGYNLAIKLVRAYSGNGNEKKGKEVTNLLEEMITKEKRKLDTQHKVGGIN